MLDRPYTFINSAMSVDGKISTKKRKQVKISGKTDFDRVDELRASSDAVMVGIGTVLADDPSLTVKSEDRRKLRAAAGKDENPARIVVDSRARTPPTADIFKKGTGKRIIVVSQAAPAERVDALCEKAEIIVAGQDEVDLKQMSAELKKRGINRLMIEGGATLNYAMVSRRLVDEISVFVGNLIIGGKDAPTFMDGPGIDERSEAVELQLLKYEQMDMGDRFNVESIIIQEFPADQRIKDLAKKYGYEEYMVARFAVLVPELEKFLVSMEAPPTVYIRVNTLKIAPNALLKRLSDKGFNLKQADLPDCFEVIEEPYSLGASAEHLLGYFYMQDKSSMIPPLALAPNPGEVVIDMAASPGGKTTHIAQLMNNEGLIIAIEKEPARLPSLRTNLGRCGVRNAAVYHMDALEAETIGLKADKILLESTATGEGVIARDRSRKTSRAEADIQFCSTLQHELIDASMKVLKPGGTLVYSTCSYAPEEDEMVVDYAVKKYGLKVEPVPYGLPGIEKFGNLTFNPQVKNTRRLFPHLHSTTGFFIARMRYV